MRKSDDNKGRRLPGADDDSCVPEQFPYAKNPDVSAALESPVSGIAGNSIDTGCLDAIRSLQRPGRPDILEKVIGQYFEDAAHQIEVMRTGYASGDAAAITGASHRIKSSSANLGALRLADLCMKLESICRDGLLPADMTLIISIEEGFIEAKSQIESYRRELSYDNRTV
ncbi:MAG: Hpt domain-containing protein [Desulfuromonadaceae bacterium]|nr:Hpt domain-containing protein [Desulfuromonadaceae bacterium]